MYNLEDYFGISGGELASQSRSSSEAPSPLRAAGESPVGSTSSTMASFTDWRRSPVFWLAAFAVFALGVIHAETKIDVALR